MKSHRGHDGGMRSIGNKERVEYKICNKRCIVWYHKKFLLFINSKGNTLVMLVETLFPHVFIST